MEIERSPDSIVLEDSKQQETPVQSSE